MAALSGPVGKGNQAVTIFPGELPELAGVEVCAFRAKKSFKPPLDIWAIPRMKPVPAGREPVELEEVPH